jgi:hypothetical protein
MNEFVNPTFERPRVISVKKISDLMYEVKDTSIITKPCGYNDMIQLWDESFSLPNLFRPTLDFLGPMVTPYLDGTKLEYQEIFLLQKRINATIYCAMRQTDERMWLYDIFVVTKDESMMPIKVRSGLHKLSELEPLNLGQLLMCFSLPSDRIYANDALTVDNLKDCGC